MINLKDILKPRIDGGYFGIYHIWRNVDAYIYWRLYHGFDVEIRDYDNIRKDLPFLIGCDESILMATLLEMQSLYVPSLSHPLDA